MTIPHKGYLINELSGISVMTRSWRIDGADGMGWRLIARLS
jgi:hypothetical protein